MANKVKIVKRPDGTCELVDLGPMTGRSRRRKKFEVIVQENADWLPDSRDEGLWIEWVAEDSEYEYLVDDREELRLVLDILPLDHLDNPTFMYRFGSGPSLHFPFDISTPAHILSGFRDGMRALPRYWHGGQYVDHAETHSARSGHSN
jgi:hypothetical protein